MASPAQTLRTACDTFRSGAVEQLKVHADCLGVDVFEQGYASDSSQVAKAAITHAKREGHDVVLVDTAGRMQNNRPHMIALRDAAKEVLEGLEDGDTFYWNYTIDLPVPDGTMRVTFDDYIIIIITSILISKMLQHVTLTLKALLRCHLINYPILIRR